MRKDGCGGIWGRFGEKSDLGVVARRFLRGRDMMFDL